MSKTSPYQLEHYYSIIERLKPAVNTPDFDRTLKDVARGLPEATRFLLKMEVKRQGRDSNKVIDLRHVSTQACQPYQHNGVTHYLDEAGIIVFEKQLRRFGKYTLGVYEAVTDLRPESREQYLQTAEFEESRDDAPSQNSLSTLDEADLVGDIIHTQAFYKRDEERMNFSQPVELFTHTNDSLHAISVDISHTGLRVKTAAEVALKTDQQVVVYFRELAKQFGYARAEGVDYQVVNIEPKSDDERYISLNRVLNKGKQDDEFMRFLRSYIRGNKGRYKVNLDNTLNAILIRGFEQYYIPQFVSIPIFLNRTGDQVTPRFILTNDCNREQLAYWQNEERQPCIGHVLRPERLKQWAQQDDHSTYLYCFSHQNKGKTIFYSASDEELRQDPTLKSTFLGCGSQRVSWRIYKVHVTEVSPQDCYSPSSLPDDVNDEVKALNAKPIPRLMARLKDLKHLVLLTDITTPVSGLTYQKRKIDKARLKDLSRFRHPETKAPQIESYRFQYQELRRQSRFMLRTAINLDTGKKIISGTTEDVSVLGVRLELSEPLNLDVDQRVFLDFPSLQKVSTKYNLRHLEYRVRHISPTRQVVSLQVRKGRNTVSEPFFSDLIKQNRRQLRLLDAKEDTLGIGESLRNIYSKHLCNTPVYLKKEGRRFLPDSMLMSTSPTVVHQVLTQTSETDQFSLAPLYRHNHGDPKPMLEHWIQRLKPEDKPVAYEVFIAAQPNGDHTKQDVDSRLSTEFGDDRARREFIQHAIRRGHFACVVVMLSKTGKPDTKALEVELDYVNTYAPHRGKALHERLWDVEAMADLVDTTDECMRRYGFNEQQIQANAGGKQNTPAATVTED